MTVKYIGGKPVGVTQIVLSTQHVDEDLTSEDVRKIVEPYIVATLPKGWISERDRLARQSHRQVRHRRTGWRHAA